MIVSSSDSDFSLPFYLRNSFEIVIATVFTFIHVDFNIAFLVVSGES